MASKYTKVGLVALALSFVFAGSTLANSELNTTGLVNNVDRNFSASTTHDHADPNMNWQATSNIPSEIDLADTYDYQVNPERFPQHDHSKATAAGESRKVTPMVICANQLKRTGNCHDLIGG
ncbi:MAG: hypothetical protein C0614_12915 [Desulfuromonas sp.]|nr:MAG: hypothetical protein C0614_12915 [Desulfuromonas sp.]